MGRVVLSTDQEKAVGAVMEYLFDGEAVVTLGGFAGTGKTTIIGEIVKLLRDKFHTMAFCTYTGKAQKVMQAKLEESQCVRSGDYLGTLHSYLYHPHEREEVLDEETGEKEVFPVFTPKDFSSKERGDQSEDLIIVDEASMVNQEIYDDLLELDIPILAVGDHGQLPPVHGNFNLMGDPMVRLEKIHRQAEANPIIQLSMIARETGRIPLGEYGDGIVVKTKRLDAIEEIKNPLEWMLISGTNELRCQMNTWMRGKKGISAESSPLVGERVICLRNNRGKRIFNGMLGEILEIEPHRTPEGNHYYAVEIGLETHDYHGIILKYQFGEKRTLQKTIPGVIDLTTKRLLDPHQFGDLWDYGYCLTAHKAQGSEYEQVVVFEEPIMRNMMQKKHEDGGWNRWLYTAVTRAKQRLLIIET